MKRIAVFLLSIATAGPAIAGPDYGNYFCYVTSAAGFYRKDDNTTVINGINAIPTDHQKFVLTYRPARRSPDEEYYCKGLLEKRFVNKANIASPI